MIRRATAEDIPDLTQLQTCVEEEGPIRGYRADSADDWAARDLGWTFVAVADGGPVGFVHCLPRPYSGECVFPADSRTLEVVDLIVAAPYRSRGLGHELIAAVQAQAREEGFTHLRVYSAARRFDDILAFYRSCGFTPWYVEMTQALRAEPSAKDADGGTHGP